MGIIFTIAVLGMYIKYIYTMCRNELHPMKQQVDFTAISKQVNELSDKVKQLQSVEDMLTDIECSSSEHLRAITLEVPNANSSNKHTILLDGTDTNSEQIKQIVLEERDKLRGSLLNDIELLYSITQQENDRKSTDRKSNRGGLQRD